MALFAKLSLRPAAPKPAPPAREAQCVRIEEAALNATAVAEQMFHDGWLLRWSPGPHRRMRCITVLAEPGTAFETRLAFAKRTYARKNLPLVFRLTSMGPDAELDGALAARGFGSEGETRVMRCPLERIPAHHTALRFERVDLDDFARTVGALRASASAAIELHARRLRQAVVESIALLAWTPDGDCAGAALAVADDELVGFFDVIVNTAYRRRGYGRALVAQAAARAGALGAKTAYLQVEQDNEAARALYQGMGFTDAYTYWYRTQGPGSCTGAGQKTL
jgi:ribosomal protein S18 acetylase RimI-like enzyme